MESPNVLFALGLTLFAGLSTGIGSAIAFFAKKTNTNNFFPHRWVFRQA
jgi:ZIP family zinc transporter